MPVDAVGLLTIVAMAAITFALRIGGVWLMARLPPSPRRDAWLSAVPGSILAAIVAPEALRGSTEAAAAAIGALVMARTGSLLLALLAGVLLAAALRQAF
jgi:uncharacterized membrane protein